MAYYDSDKIKQFFFIAFILIIGGILFWKLAIFIPAFLGALTLYVIMRPVHFFLVDKRHWKNWISAIVLIIVSAIVILVPMGLVANMMTKKVSVAINHSEEIITSIKHLINQIKLSYNVDLLSQDTLHKIQEALTTVLPQILGSTFNVLTTIVMMYFILYFMLAEARGMEALLSKNIPLKKSNTRRLEKEMKAMVISNAVGIPLLAIAQGL
ncbi:MAG TPA: AI-2E family transporter, partial [Chitinophagaceae bacterium]|nr:AI-2E family transporter [Chitinophagaceae bacterium]